MPVLTSKGIFTKSSGSIRHHKFAPPETIPRVGHFILMLFVYGIIACLNVYYKNLFFFSTCLYNIRPGLSVHNTLVNTWSLLRQFVPQSVLYLNVGLPHSTHTFTTQNIKHLCTGKCKNLIFSRKQTSFWNENLFSNCIYLVLIIYL